MVDKDSESEIDVTDNNQVSWNYDTYNAWIERFGTPNEIARKIIDNPLKMLSSLREHFIDIKGKRILNIMGSNGIKGVALAVLGADVTIVDFSEGNKKYALEVAAAANVTIKYIQTDILDVNEYIGTNTFDIEFAEMGILHYFNDLKPFMKIIYEMLKENGKFIVKDFHPVSTKLLTYRGSTAKVRKYKVTGDYFDTRFEKVEVAFSKFLQGDDDKKYAYIRKWTLGEIVTAMAESGLIICSLKEEPNRSSDVFDKGIPKTFTIVSRK